jgi:CIC family chloride channel protein
MFGAAVGHVAHAVAPAHTAAVGAYALVGMGAMFAGTVRTPLTSVIMIFEVTRDYSIIVPLMISNLIAFYVSQRIHRSTIYEALARQDGIHLPTGTAEHSTRELRVERAMRSLERLVSDNLVVDDVLSRMTAAGDARAVIVQDGALVTVAERELREAAHRGEGQMPVGRVVTGARDSPAAQGTSPIHLHTDHPLSLALQRMGEARRDVLPVVSRSDVRILLGAITLDDVLQAYQVRPRSSAE